MGMENQPTKVAPVNPYNADFQQQMQDGVQNNPPKAPLNKNARIFKIILTLGIILLVIAGVGFLTVLLYGGEEGEVSINIVMYLCYLISVETGMFWLFVIGGGLATIIGAIGYLATKNKKPDVYGSKDTNVYIQN